jgi:hypothetical protein
MQTSNISVFPGMKFKQIFFSGFITAFTTAVDYFALFYAS